MELRATSTGVDCEGENMLVIGLIVAVCLYAILALLWGHGWRASQWLRNHTRSFEQDVIRARRVSLHHPARPDFDFGR